MLKWFAANDQTIRFLAISYIVIFLPLAIWLISLPDSTEILWKLVLLVVSIVAALEGLIFLVFPDLPKKIVNFYLSINFYLWAIPSSLICFLLALFLLARSYIGPIPEITECEPDYPLSVVCVVNNPEDLAVTPDNNFLIVSEFGGIEPLEEMIPGKLSLLDLITEESLPLDISYSTNTWGDLPGSLKDYLKEFMKTRKPKIDWRRNLRLFTENSQNTYLSNTLKRPSRRYKKIAHFPDGSPMYETKKGVPVKDENGNFIPVWVPKYPGLKVRQRSRLLVAIDTSGSIRTEEDLPKFFNEMYHLQKKQVEILVVEVDEWIQRIYPFPLPEGQIEVKGRGGTDYNELIKYANGEEIDRSGTTKSYQRGHTYSKAAGITVWEKGNWAAKESIKLNKQIDGIVYFTDGQAATPFEKSKLPILWILAGIGVIDENSKSYNDLPGQKVKIED